MSRDAPSLDELYGPGAEAADAQALEESAMALRIADHVVQSVADLGDRTRSEDQPEMMLVTGEELHDLIIRAFELEWERKAVNG